MDIQWQAPPPDRRSRKKSRRSLELDELAEILHANPGKWALVATTDYPGNGKQYQQRGLEMATRTRPDGRFDKYARAPEK
jgi:hypothetical protein